MLRLRLPWAAAALVATALAVMLARGGARERPQRKPSPQPSAAATPSHPPPSEARASEAPAGQRPTRSVFASAADCAELLARGERLLRRAGVARFASWNLRWFPDGGSGTQGQGVDVAWLSCVLAWLDADVIAVQEVKQTPRAERALASLLTEANRASKRSYVARLDDCGSGVPQHVGLLWDSARVRGTQIETVAALNPHGQACEGQLRPGLAARFRLPGGLDLDVVSAHFKSKSDSRSYELRRASFAALPRVLRARGEAARDQDFLLLGDLNTMGCDACAPPISPRAELDAWQGLLTGAGLRFVPADATFTHLSGGRTSLLDHAVAATAMQELSTQAKSHVEGPCATAGGSERKRRSSLSDHCPLVLDLTDRDLD